MKSNLRVALIAAGNGGYAIQLAQGLSESCKSVLLFQFRDDAKELKRDFPEFFKNIKFQHILFGHYSRLNPLRYLNALTIVSRIIKEQCDIVHIVNSGAVGVIFHVARLSRALGIPIIFTLHDAQFHPGDHLQLHAVRILIKTMELSNSLIVHGKQIAESATQNLLVNPGLMRIIPHGNFDLYLEHVDKTDNTPGNKKQILLFGRMKKYKGLSTLEQCAPLLSKTVPEAKIIIAGKGPELDKRARDLARHPNVEIQNCYLTAAQAATLFSQASVVILPYLEASQSGPLCMAYSFSKPVVASSVGSLPEVVDNNINGILVPPGDPEALAAAITKLLNKPDLTKSMGEASRRKALTTLLWSGDIATKTIEVYNHAQDTKKENRKNELSDSQVRKKRWTRVKNYYRNYCNELVDS